MNTTYAPTRWWTRSASISVLIALISAILLYFSYMIVGNIPLDGGAGWDGGLYRLYAQMTAAGAPITGDPYRAIRLSGFLPMIGASRAGVPLSELVTFQTYLNIGIIAMTGGLFHDTLRKLDVSPKVALLTTATLVVSWPMLVLPVFYPLLSDHIALLLSCLCLWCWARSFQTMLYLLIVYCLWVMPGLFLIPLVLAGMPYAKSAQPESRPHRVLTYVLFGISVLVVFPYLLKMIGNIPDEYIRGHGSPQGGLTSALSLRQIATGTLLASAAFVLWLSAKVVSDLSVWKSINPGATIMALVFFSGGLFAMYFLIDWSTGFTGPPLLIFLLIQSLAAPFKPLVAHFLFFGPIMMMAFAAFASWAIGRQSAPPRALLVCLLGFMPLLALGSESRQWIGILPVAATVAALGNFSMLQRKIGLIVTLALIIPAIWLHENIETAVTTQLSFQSSAWQFHFGRQGPWMSFEVYELGMLLLGLYGLVMFGAYRYEKRQSQPRSTSLATAA